MSLNRARVELFVQNNDDCEDANCVGGTCQSKIEIQLQKFNANLPEQQFRIIPLESIPSIEDKKGLRVDALDDQHTDKCKGSRFRFNLKEWEDQFGRIDPSTVTVKVKRCSIGGSEKWTGFVDAAKDGVGHRTDAGHQQKECNQWEKNDYLVKPSEECVRISKYLFCTTLFFAHNPILALVGLHFFF